MSKSFILFFVISLLGFLTIKAQQPNIIWITSEDNSKHYMKLFCDNGIETPNIERLADHGLLFENAFSNAAVCSAARSTLITSIYGPKLASHYHRAEQKITLPKEIEMFPAYLKKAGYYTANNSKEDYNIIKSQNVWDDSSKNASWKNRKKGQPFFYVFNTGTTHESKLHFTEAEMKAKKTVTDVNKVFVQPNHPKTAIFKYTNTYYQDLITSIDKEIGVVIDDLKKDGLLENTFIFYFSDHGGVLPNSKGYLTETGLNVPLVVYIPPKYQHLSNFLIGSKVNGFVSFVDFGVTVLNLAGIEIPRNMDGKPFLGKNQKTEEIEARDETFGYADRFDEKYDMVRSFRKGKFKYIRNFQPFNIDALMNNYRYKQLAYQEWQELHKKNKLNKIQSKFFEPKLPEELYDIESDPYETNNLANKPEYQKTLLKMRNGLMSWMQKMPDLSFYPEHYLILNAFEDPIKFGKGNKSSIKKYIKVSNLALLDYDKVLKKIKASLKSQDPWERYWAIVLCSSFGKKANNLTKEIKHIIGTDTELINKVRAAEFLGIIGAQNPAEVMLDALYNSENKLETLMILNSIVLMRDYYHKYPINIQLKKINKKVRENKLVKQRLIYLNLLSAS